MSNFITIFRKEFTDTIRDRRTVMFMIVIPLLMAPLFLGVITMIQMKMVRKAAQKTLSVALVQNHNANAFCDSLKLRKDIRILSPIAVDSLQPRLRRGALDAGLVIAGNFDSSVAANLSGNIQLYYRSSDDYNIVKSRIMDLIKDYEKKLINVRFENLKLDQSIVDAVNVEEHDVATKKETIGKAAGGMLPYIFVLFCFMGAMYPAIDLIAGEKERGTMETLLTAPVSRYQILQGKFAVVALAGVFSALASVGGLFIAVQQIPNIPNEIMSTITSILDGKSIVLIVSLMVPLTVFFTALLLSLSMYAKSYKEAQAIISPLSFVFILPLVIGMVPGIELTALTAVIPVLNVSLAAKEIVAGTIKPLLLTEVYISLILLSALSMWGCVRWFQREETIFRGV